MSWKPLGCIPKQKGRPWSDDVQLYMKNSQIVDLGSLQRILREERRGAVNFWNKAVAMASKEQQHWIKRFESGIGRDILLKKRRGWVIEEMQPSRKLEGEPRNVESIHWWYEWFQMERGYVLPSAGRVE
uniref:Uncharacterized protein n=1 Tax=Romanomermis culicivorax TaxID=13658 RepID=A0A915K0T3_ROMCU